MDEQTVRKEIQIAFEYSFMHDDWINPLINALTGVTAAEAAWKPGPDSKGIWDIVLHIAVWTENIIERIRSGADIRPTEGSWPPPPTIPDDAAWQAAQQRLWDALNALHAFIETSSLDTLAGSPYGLGDLLCRFIHNAYHIGQITKLRELRAATSTTT
jgi:hypothetical protein